jgi:uncharacterized protein YciI
MFVINLRYIKPIEEIDAHLIAHRNFLGEGYKNQAFIASGPKNPRDGGIILSQLKDRKTLENLIKQDPFYIHQLAEYEIIEFTPVKFHPDFEKFL